MKIVDEKNIFNQYSQKGQCIYTLENNHGDTQKVRVAECFIVHDSDYNKAIHEIIVQNHKLAGGFLEDKGLLKDHAEHLIIAYMEDEVVGFCTLKGVNVTKDGSTVGKSLHILQIGVRKKATHQGVGTCLLKYAEDHSKDYMAINAEIDEHNLASLALFKGCGFNLIKGKREGEKRAIKDVRELKRKPFAKAPKSHSRYI